MRRDTSVGDILAYRLCPRYYRELVRGKRPVDEFQVTGNVVHKRVVEGSSAEALAYQKAQLALIPEEKRAEVAEEIEELVKTAQEMVDDEVTEENQEVQLKWFDSLTGWTVFAKPDELFYTGEGYSRVMQITEIKSKALRVKRGHKDQLFMFGLIASLAHDYRGPIRLVVRLPRVEEEHEFWYSPKATPRELEALRATLLEMEASWRERNFPCRSGNWCRGCPQLASCQDGCNRVGLPAPVTGNVVALPAGAATDGSLTRTA